MHARMTDWVALSPRVPGYVAEVEVADDQPVKAGDVRAELHYGEPQGAGGMDRRTWAQVLRRDIGAMLDSAA